MGKDWTGDTNSIFKALGATNHSDSNRAEHDYYATDPITIDLLINDGHVDFKRKVWECSCGTGHLSERLKEYGVDVYSSDLVDRGYGESNIDFLKTIDVWDGDILTNPPYKYAADFVNKSMQIVPDGHRSFMLLKLTFLEGKARRKLFEKYPPKCIYVFSSRICCAKNGNFAEAKKVGSAVAYAWFEFEKGFSGDPIIKWIG